MRIFLPCWGDKHIALLESCLLKSLFWYDNIDSLQESEWLVTTNTKMEADKIKAEIKMMDQRATVSAVISDEVKNNTGPFLLSVLKQAIKLCLLDQKPMLMATPDYIYGDGTIPALKTIGSEKGSVVGLAHMRATPEIIKELPDVSSPNSDLVTLGLEFAHPAWIQSDERIRHGVTFYGGISWQDLTESSFHDKVIAVRHRLPAPFFANFLKSDLDFFNNTHNHPHDHTFALWDHLWQSHLINENRFRYIGSSDLALMIEVTDVEANVPPENPPGKTNKDDYIHRYFHNDMCKQFVTVFRGSL